MEIHPSSPANYHPGAASFSSGVSTPISVRVLRDNIICAAYHGRETPNSAMPPQDCIIFDSCKAVGSVSGIEGVGLAPGVWNQSAQCIHQPH